MKPKGAFFFFVMSLAVSGAAHAAPSYSKRDQYRPHMRQQGAGQTTFDFKTGLRINNFDWNIASDLSGTATPNILSELTWEDLTIFEIQGRLRHLGPASAGFLKGNVLLEAEVTAGATLSGDNQDSDYAGDNRTLEFSRSNNDGSGGYSIGGAVDIGYRFNVAQKVRSGSATYFTLAPFAGYGWDRQQYKTSNGRQTIPPLGNFSGLDSEYTATWQGPFFGLEAELQRNRHSFILRGEHHILDYDAEATWNLRDDFQQDPSFEHGAEGDGLELGFEYLFAMDSRYVFSLDIDYSERQGEDGSDTTYFSDGTISNLRLNEVNDESYSLRAGLGYVW